MREENPQEKENVNLEQPEDLEELESIPEADDKAPESTKTRAQKEPGTFQHKKSRRLPPLLRLTRRATVFLSLTLIATIIFFVTGNKQTFLDSNLNMILKIIALNAIALVFFSLAAVTECVFYTIKSKKIRLIIHLICYTLIFLLSLAISILSLTINLLSEGIDF